MGKADYLSNAKMGRHLEEGGREGGGGQAPRKGGDSQTRCNLTGKGAGYATGVIAKDGNLGKSGRMHGKCAPATR